MSPPIKNLLPPTLRALPQGGQKEATAVVCWGWEAKISAEQLGKISFIDIQEPTKKKLHTRNAEETENSARSEYSESIISKFFSLYELPTTYFQINWNKKKNRPQKIIAFWTTKRLQFQIFLTHFQQNILFLLHSIVRSENFWILSDFQSISFIFPMS